jgi:hypothetical protein
VVAEYDIEVVGCMSVLESLVVFLGELSTIPDAR